MLGGIWKEQTLNRKHVLKLVAGVAAASAVAIMLSGLAFITTAEAAPPADRFETLEAECGDLGEVTVVIPGQGRGTAAFANGQVLVAHEFSGEFDLTVVVDDTTIFDDTVAFDEPHPGQGFRDRLVVCTFALDFEETIVLTAEDLALLGIDDPTLIGQEATITGSGEVMVHVQVPGRP